jgi:hypothetical protein
MIREEELANRLGQILKDIYIPDGILAILQDSLLHDKGRAEAHARAERERLTQRLAQVRGRLERAYMDKLDGKISDQFWEHEIIGAWTQEEQQVLYRAYKGFEQQASPERILEWRSGL